MTKTSFSLTPALLLLMLAPAGCVFDGKESPDDLGADPSVEAAASAGVTYYVATTGSDGNSCAKARNKATPKKTISAGIACLASGETLVIRGGTYDERVNLKSIASGTSGAYTTIKAAAGENVWLRPLSNHSTGTLPIVLMTNGRNHVRFERIGVDGSGYTGKTTSGIFGGFNAFRLGGSEAVHHVILDGVEIKNIIGTNADAIGIGETSYGIVIRNSYIHDVGGVGGVGDGDTHPNGAVYMHGSVIDGKDPNIVENNRIEDVADFGVNIRNCKSGPAGGCGDPINDVIVRRNVFRNVGCAICSSNADTDVLAYNNVIIDSKTAFSIRATSKGFGIYHNTVYDMSGAGVRGSKQHEAPTQAQMAAIKNNIFFKVGHPEFIPDGNLTDDPKFVEAEAENFRLQPGSPAINKGTLVSAVKNDADCKKRPSGGGYDMGAYEIGGDHDAGCNGVAPAASLP